MTEEKNLSNTTPTTEAKQTEGPLLLEIKAAVEKLAGDVRSLTERMNKAEKKPEDKYPPPCKSAEELEAEKAKKPIIPYPKKKEDISEEEKAKKPTEYPYPKKQDEADHGCSADEEWDEATQACVPKSTKQAAKKPEEYPYPKKSDEEEKAKKPEELKPGKEKKSTDIIAEQFEDLKNEVTSLRKCLGMPAFKRTQVIKKEDIDAPIDVSAMSWAQVHELARPIDLRRGA